MAIVIEEERNKLSFVTLVSWIAVLAIVVIAVYYLFIRNPGKVEVILPGFKNTEQITKIYLDPKTVVNNPAFSGRLRHIISPQPGIVGRENPFLPL